MERGNLLRIPIFLRIAMLVVYTPLQLARAGVWRWMYGVVNPKLNPTHWLWGIGHWLTSSRRVSDREPNLEFAPFPLTFTSSADMPVVQIDQTLGNA